MRRRQPDTDPARAVSTELSEDGASPGNVDTTRGWLPRSVGLALAFVLGGLLGLAFVGILTFGALFRTVVAIAGVPACPTGQNSAAYDPGPAPLVNMEKAVMWPVTGLGMAYAQLQHAHRCLIVAEGVYYDTHHNSFFGGKSFTIGDVFLSRPRTDESIATRLGLPHRT
jgi:hypothetical protein